MDKQKTAQGQKTLGVIKRADNHEMTKYLLAFILTFFIALPYYFGQTPDSLNLQKTKAYINKGPSISLGPEVIISKEYLYGANANFRFWYRTGGNGRIRIDNTINFSVGFFRVLVNNLFKFKAGDFILLTSGRYGDIRLGIFADYIIANKTEILAVDCSIGLRLPKIYFYIGGIQPLGIKQNSLDINTSFSIGLDFYLFERKSYHH